MSLGTPFSKRKPFVLVCVTALLFFGCGGGSGGGGLGLTEPSTPDVKDDVAETSDSVIGWDGGNDTAGEPVDQTAPDTWAIADTATGSDSHNEQDNGAEIQDTVSSNEDTSVIIPEDTHTVDPEDGVVLPFCGDDNCDPDEDCTGCPQDCGDCPLAEVCCKPSTVPGCSTVDIQECTCDFDPYCCDVQWDDLCVAAAVEQCGLQCEGTCGNTQCDDSEDCGNCPEDCGRCTSCGDLTCDTPETCENCPEDCGECPPPEWTGLCCEANPTPGCEDSTITDCVCDLDTSCCTGTWDEACAQLAQGACGLDCPPICGDLECEPTETCSSCPTDCGKCVTCGNGKVDAGEECEAGQTTTCAALGGLGGTVACQSATCSWDDNICTPCTPTTVGCPGGPVCDQGLCCDPQSGQYLSKGTLCGDTPLSFQTQCSGANIQQREAYFGCAGGTAVCSNEAKNWVWSDWKTVKTCKSEEYCTTAKGFAECIIAECTSGTCCSTNTKTFKPQGTKCGTAVTTTEKACAGNSIVERKAYDGCSGTDAGCSTSSTNWSYTGWTVVESCGGGMSCKMVNNTPTCLGESLCTSGPCCDVAKQAFKPVGSLCADATSPKILGWLDMKCNGAQKQEHEGYRGCSGKSAQCSLWEGHAFWEAWKTTETCVSNNHCLEVTSTQDTNIAGGSHYKKAFCAPKYTSANAACYTGTDPFSAPKPYASKCGDTAKAWQVRCIDGKAQTRPIYPGCAYSGSYGCTGGHYGPWQLKEDCGPGKFCFQYLGGEYLTAAEAQNFSGYKCLSTSTPATCSITGQLCGTGPVNEIYNCDANTNSIVRLTAITTCAANGSCPTTYSGTSKWGVMWEPIQNCGTNALCEMCAAGVTIPGSPGGAWLKSGTASLTKPKCEPLLGDFTPGGLCSDCKTGTFDPPGTNCFDTPSTSQYICQGNDIWRRQGYFTCDGAGTCSTSATAIAWGEYTFYQSCSDLFTCTEVSSTKSAYCKLKDNLAGCGQPCNATTVCTAGTCLAGKCQSALCQQCIDQGLECDLTTNCGFYKCKSTGGGGTEGPGGPGVPIEPDTNGCYPMEGTISKKNFSQGGISFVDFTILYSLDSLIGEPLFFGTYKYTTQSKNVTLPPFSMFYLHVKVGSTTKSIPFGPVIPKDGSGDWGFQVKQSPSWSKTFCDPVDPPTGCLDTEAAKTFFKSPPCVTGFTIVLK
ncbi:MAG: hypothetical protein HUU55_08535 [Myxococcales bacterium]|nr:hypothetical protein [Myxococcales bacterium]